MAVVRNTANQKMWATHQNLSSISFTIVLIHSLAHPQTHPQTPSIKASGFGAGHRCRLISSAQSVDSRDPTASWLLCFPSSLCSSRPFWLALRPYPSNSLREVQSTVTLSAPSMALLSVAT